MPYLCDMNSEIELAIIESNTLTCLGLRQMLMDLIPGAAVRSFSSFAELMQDTPFGFVHYFVSSSIYFQQVNFFRQLGNRVILLVQGTEQAAHLGIPALDVTQSEHQLLQQMLRMRDMGGSHGSARAHEAFHGAAFAHVPRQQPSQQEPDLSSREIEVLSLLVRGMINKEIAERLHISLTTVITHRKNIQAKTGIRSLSGLTVYAILNNYVRVEEI